MCTNASCLLTLHHILESPRMRLTTNMYQPFLLGRLLTNILKPISLSIVRSIERLDHANHRFDKLPTLSDL